VFGLEIEGPDHHAKTYRVTAVQPTVSRVAEHFDQHVLHAREQQGGDTFLLSNLNAPPSAGIEALACLVDCAKYTDAITDL
jgi:hypothetical protein